MRRALVAVSVWLLLAACAAPEQSSTDRASGAADEAGRSGGAATDVSRPPTSTGSSAGPTQPAPSSDPEGAGRTVVVGDSDYGPMLYDGRGQAIYLFDKERSPRPRCYGECAAAWPPVSPTALRAQGAAPTRRFSGPCAVAEASPR